MNDFVFDKVYILSFIYIIVMFVIGCLGNLIVFYIYFICWRKIIFRVFILVLVVFDLINCFIIILMEFYFMFNWF